MLRGLFMLLASGVWLGSAAMAHNHACVHSHPIEESKENSLCEPVDADCTTDDDPGTCKHQVTSRRQWCWCRPNESDSCVSSGRNEFAPSMPGLPGPGESRGYLAVLSPNNGWSVVDNDVLVAEFEPADDAVQGSLQLDFGSFADPINIPVTLTDLQIQLPPVTVAGMSTGPNVLRLRNDGVDVSLTYDSVTGVISPSGISIPLALDNDKGTEQLVTFWFEAQVLPDGRLDLYGQGLTSMPLGAVPAVSGLSALMMFVLMLGAGAIIVKRGRSMA